MKLRLSDTETAYAAIGTAGRDGERRCVAMLLPELFREMDPSALCIDHDPYGKPLLAGYDGHISISHGGGIAIVARNDHTPIGIDIEAPRPQLERVMRRFVGDKDFMRGDRPLLDWLLALWTAKEAVYKAASTPGLALAAIAIVNPCLAILPDGREYRLTTYPCDGNLITLAEQIPGK